jgi:hypothetical protein
MGIEYREEPCKSALNPVKGMGFKWSLNPYMGCVHRCTFCYVRAFEQRSDRPSDDRYGTSIRVKTNIAEVLRKELARSTWRREQVTVGAATDPYQPVEGKYKLTRACLEVFRDAANPFGIITRGPMIVRDLDVLVEAAGRAEVAVTFSIPTLDARRGCLEADRAVDRSPPAAVAGPEGARRRRRQGERRYGTDPPGDLGPTRAAARSRSGRARGRSHRNLGQPALPAAGDA